MNSRTLPLAHGGRKTSPTWNYAGELSISTLHERKIVYSNTIKRTGIWHKPSLPTVFHPDQGWTCFPKTLACRRIQEWVLLRLKYFPFQLHLAKYLLYYWRVYQHDQTDRPAASDFQHWTVGGEEGKTEQFQHLNRENRNEILESQDHPSSHIWKQRK